MYEAFEPRTGGQSYRFRDMDSLVWRLGGDGWCVVHEDAFDPGPRRTVHITKWLPAEESYGVVATLRVPTEALDVPPDTEDKP